MLRYILTAALGGALVYFLDPDRGKRRRHMARDRAAATARRTSRLVGTRVRYATSTAQGLADKAAHSHDEEALPLDEATLAHKVESEIFRDPAIPKGNININVEDGVVVLRGRLDRLEDISALETKVREVAGVHQVKNLLHVPGMPPPNGDSAEATAPASDRGYTNPGA